MKYNRLPLFLLISLIIVIPIVTLVPFRSIEAGAGSSWYGGKVNIMFPCTCDPELQYVVLGPPSAGSYLYEGQIDYREHSLTFGVWALGKYSPGGECLMGVEPYCYTLPVSKGTIDSFTGVSLPF